MGETRQRILVHTGWILDGSIAHVASLRRLVHEALPAECARRSDVELVAGELATNAVTHSRAAVAGGFAVELTVTPGRVELAVHDPGGPERPRLTQPPDPLANPDLPVEAVEHGRGLTLVDAHADSWGYTGDGNGCTVWASFELPQTLPIPTSGSEDSQDYGGRARQPGSDFPGPGGVVQPPENVLTYLLGPN